MDEAKIIKELEKYQERFEKQAAQLKEVDGQIDHLTKRAEGLTTQNVNLMEFIHTKGLMIEFHEFVRKKK
ncbi:hypothetical protein [Alkalihalobacterium alkalinitrilicum]|uniref:hypothetical protein n=1 Tax=Alkalihalobacterium alkalinitrilicum TaxID=427920 RepID=UPI000994BCF4|nr:hypothetical protein [Alkalihalobacterium alkalinitrilicum]